MDPALLLLILPAIIIPLVFRWKFDREVTNGELAAHIAIGIVVVASVYWIGRGSQWSDSEFLNGMVTSKSEVTVPCSHSYQCHCRTVTSGSGKNRSSSTVCDTCYEHFHDYNWDVASTVGNFTIDRVDRQGVIAPPRWNAVQNGQPVALAHSYSNYIKGAPDSLFNAAALLTTYKGKIPEYPQPYDYQYADRVIPVGVTIPDLAIWNQRLAMALRLTGPSKQANMVVVITNEASPTYAKALRQAWLGGKKNDVVTVIGAPHHPAIAWVDTFSWSKHDMVNVAIRNDLLGLKTADPATVIDTINRDINAYYLRRPMEEFAYLKNDAQAPTWVIVLALLLSTAGSIGLGMVFVRNDLRNQVDYSRLRYR